MICYDTIELIVLKVQLSFEFQRFEICLHNSDEISTHVLLNVCFYDRVRRTFGVVVLIEDVYWDKRRSRDEVLLLVICYNLMSVSMVTRLGGNGRRRLLGY